MKYSYGQYINNPLGEKNSVITNRGMYYTMYKEKLDKILLREGGKVKYTLYKSKDKYYIHFKIPSEVVNNFYYDTVIEFYTDDPIKEKVTNLRDYYVRFYSNDPSFVYTFAHAFIKNDLFIKDLESKMTKESRKHVAVEKNPGNLVGYVKSLFFAYILIGDYSLFSKAAFNNALPYNKSKLLKEIENAKDKIKARQEEQEKIVKQKRKEREDNISDNRKSLFSNNVSNTKKVKVISKVSNTRKSGNIRKTKKI